jgi:hypothetical protein
MPKGKKMAAIVFHADHSKMSCVERVDILGFAKPEKIVAAISSGMLTYNPVALLMACNDREKAYCLTNTIDDNWWTNEGLTPLFKDIGCRSTSPGDIVWMSEDNTSYVVLPMGWAKITFSHPTLDDAKRALDNVFKKTLI